jgi:hypothetical protein
MATTTTNFGWDIPQSTDLVKDGATAIAALGQDIDTALVDLKGGTTGQILAKASNTDLDYSWITNDVGDITAVTAGTGISGGGTSGAVTVTNSMATAIDAKGDLIGGTGADTFSRLAVGANGTVLTADSAETTGLKWAAPAASGLTFIAKSTATNTSSHNIANCFTSDYTNYRVIFNFSAVSSAGMDTGIQLSSSGTPATSGYNSQRFFGGNTTVGADVNGGGNDEWNFLYVSSNFPGSPYGSIEFGNPQVAANSNFHSYGYMCATGQQYFFINGGFLNNTTQYDGFTIKAGANFSADFYIYGYKKA